MSKTLLPQPTLVGVLSGLAVLGAITPKGLCAQSRDTRPNIVLFVVDDMGWQDTSYPFASDTTALNRRYHTPNMERLASQGMSFTSAYASSISSPSRVSLLTGMNAARHRVTNWTFRRDSVVDAPSQTLQLPEWNLNGISPVRGIPRTAYATPLPELLRQAGYYTIHVGKAHWGAIGSPGADPCNMGFDINVGGHAAGGPLSYLGTERFGHDTDGRPRSPFATPGLERYWGQDIFLSEALTREAIRSVEEAPRDQPFFLHLAHYAIHIPLDKDMRYYEHYKAAGLPDHEAAYASLIEGMDKSLGDVMQWLEQTGRAENTVVLFVSDNGGLSAVSYWRDGELHHHNAPLHSGKGSAYEGGVRVPMMARWPGVTPRGVRVDGYLSIEDFFPTILGIAGVKPEGLPQQVDGRSFLSILRGGSTRTMEHRDLYWNCPNLWGPTGPGIGTTCSVRSGRYKLVYYYDTGRKELFDLREDLGETHDLAPSKPRLVQRLSRKLGRYLRSVGGQRPSFKVTGKPCPWPDEL